VAGTAEEILPAPSQVGVDEPVEAAAEAPDEAPGDETPPADEAPAEPAEPEPPPDGEEPGEPNEPGAG